jgi:isocitrate dehydrogenase
LQQIGVPIEFERYDYHWTELGDGSLAYKDIVSSLARNRVGLKGSFFTPLGDKTVSRNVQIRKDLGKKSLFYLKTYTYIKISLPMLFL